MCVRAWGKENESASGGGKGRFNNSFLSLENQAIENVILRY